jgi:hypothetical protein
MAQPHVIDNMYDALGHSLVKRAIFEKSERNPQACEPWIVFNPPGGRPAALDAKNVIKICVEILDLPIPQWTDPGTVSGEIDWR